MEDIAFMEDILFDEGRKCLKTEVMFRQNLTNEVEKDFGCMRTFIQHILKLTIVDLTALNSELVKLQNYLYHERDKFHEKWFNTGSIPLPSQEFDRTQETYEIIEKAKRMVNETARLSIEGSSTIKYRWLHIDSAMFRSTYNYLNDVAHNVGCYIMLVRRTKVEKAMLLLKKHETKNNEKSLRSNIKRAEFFQNPKESRKKSPKTPPLEQETINALKRYINEYKKSLHFFHIPGNPPEKEVISNVKEKEQPFQEETPKEEHNYEKNPMCPSKYKYPKKCTDRQNYIEQLKIFHPDKNLGCKKAAIAKFTVLQELCKREQDNKGGKRKEKTNKKRKNKNKTKKLSNKNKTKTIA